MARTDVLGLKDPRPQSRCTEGPEQTFQCSIKVLMDRFKVREALDTPKLTLVRSAISPCRTNNLGVKHDEFEMEFRIEVTEQLVLHG